MKEYRQQFFKGERALYAEDGACIYDSIFDEGESPLKESKNIEVYDSQFKYKYPIWYSNNVIGLRWAVRVYGTQTIST